MIPGGHKKECLKVHVTGTATTVFTLGFKLILWKGLDISVNRVLIQHSIQVWLNSALNFTFCSSISSAALMRTLSPLNAVQPV